MTVGHQNGDSLSIDRLPVCKSKGGLQPGLDLDNTAELLNILDQATERAKLR
jgi:hypothetical protein